MRRQKFGDAAYGMVGDAGEDVLNQAGAEGVVTSTRWHEAKLRSTGEAVLPPTSPPKRRPAAARPHHNECCVPVPASICDCCFPSSAVQCRPVFESVTFKTRALWALGRHTSA